MVLVTVKWKKEKFSNVELDPTMPPLVFKAQLFALTGVPVERQKLMCKAWKGVLNDDADFSGMKITDGMQLMLMGSAEVIQEPQIQVKFIEDMTSEEQTQTGVVLPSGFTNLGNTCYMNSTLECLRYVPELREGLTHYRIQNHGNDLTTSLAQTYEQIDRSNDPVAPGLFLQRLRMEFPQFAQRGERGHFMQQDAEEFFVSLAQVLSETLHEPFGLSDLGGTNNLFDALFGFRVQVTLTCKECEEEPPIVKHDNLRTLVCNIQGGAGSTEQVHHMHEGIRVGLCTTLEKQSDILERNAMWEKIQKLDRLPRYICVQFMRFFWKETPDSRDHTGVKCKIMKPVTFPQVFDIFEFCTERLQSLLQVNRRNKEEVKENESMEVCKNEEKEEKEEKGGNENGDDDKEDEKLLEQAIEMSKLDNGMIGPGLPPDFTGNYELFGIVTHKGREADSGHYMGWVRQKDDDWVVFDDDEVSNCKTEDVMKLKGGGDWPMSYLSFYRFKN